MPNKFATSVPFVQPYRYPSPNIPLTAIRRFARKIAERFHPQQVILFGSYAYGTPHAESDVDLLVVMPTRNTIDQALRIVCAFDREFCYDLLVRTPAQIERRLADEDWFLREIVGKGIVLYEANDSTLGSESRGRHRRGQGNGRSHTAVPQSGVLPLPAIGGKISESTFAGIEHRRAANA